MAKNASSGLSGVLIIDKPAGWTSHDVVGRLRRLSGERRIGHAGTLDPFATGLLVVAVGQATRLLRFMDDTAKGYRAVVRLGAATDSADVDGQLIDVDGHATWPSGDEVDAAAASFVGTIQQRPPIFSAIHVDGRRAYDLAREGTLDELPERSVTIHAIRVEAYDPPDIVLDVVCAGGTYIRSLARDLGASLGFPAYCHALQRTNCGPFCLADAHQLTDLAEVHVPELWPEIALHPDTLVQHLPAVILHPNAERDWYDGKRIPLATVPSPGSEVRAYTDDGWFVGIGDVSADGQAQPRIVMRRTPQELDA